MPDKPGNPQAHGVEGLAAMAARLGELETLFGPRAQPVVHRLRGALLDALAARDRGDAPAAAGRLRAAMEELVRLFGEIDPNEAAAMGRLVAGFQEALSQGQGDAAGRMAEDMRRHSGAVERTPTRAGDDEEG
jgi:hypothetical protein